MTGTELYLLLLGPCLAALAGAAVWLMARGTWTPEYQANLRQLLEETVDRAGGKRTPPGE